MVIHKFVPIVGQIHRKKTFSLHLLNAKQQLHPLITRISEWLLNGRNFRADKMKYLFTLCVEKTGICYRVIAMSRDGKKVSHAPLPIWLSLSLTGVHCLGPPLWATDQSFFTSSISCPLRQGDGAGILVVLHVQYWWLSVTRFVSISSYEH